MSQVYNFAEEPFLDKMLAAISFFRDPMRGQNPIDDLVREIDACSFDRFGLNFVDAIQIKIADV